MNELALFQRAVFLNLKTGYQNQLVTSYQIMREAKKMKAIEAEWAKYKYLVLEHSHAKYLEIRELLKDKTHFPFETFLTLLAKALQEEVTNTAKLNAIAHVWGYFKNLAEEDEKESYKKLVQQFLKDEVSFEELKCFLYELTKKYEVSFLADSYYFIDIDRDG